MIPMEARRAPRARPPRSDRLQTSTILRRPSEVAHRNPLIRMISNGRAAELAASKDRRLGVVTP